jgi:hypothetical protein
MHLVYTTLGFDGNYVRCLPFLLDSIAAYTPLDKKPSFDFLLICDSYLYAQAHKIIATKIYPFAIKYLIVEDAMNPMLASMNKLKVFDYPFIKSYKGNVFFVDIDIIARVNIMEAFLDRDSLIEGILYACKEKDDIQKHKHPFWSLEGDQHEYTDKDLETFKERDIYPFNAGCFLFKNCDAMREHFANIQVMIEGYKLRYFFEQSFMNVYFNKRGLVCYDVLTSDNYIMLPDVRKKYEKCLVHFCGCPGDGEHKVNIITKYWNEFIVGEKKSEKRVVRKKIL